ncbi:MAG: ABC transporter ATP-binding protein [Acidimicrobiales bacterium]
MRSRVGDARDVEVTPVTSDADGAPVLALENVSAAYGDTVVLRNFSLSVPRRSVVTLLGPNGAGKTTVMRLVSGTLRPTAGTIWLNGVDVTGVAAHKRAAKGECLIPEGRGIFRSLSVRENLDLFRPKTSHDVALDQVLDVFPVLAERLSQVAGTLSGGEQQMLALSRAFFAKPDIVLVDEVSIGLAPKIVDQIFEILQRLASEGISLLIVEQYVRRALDLADTVYLLNRGEIVLRGSTKEITYDEVADAYLR